ncbi:MAG: hypothetical protein ACLR5H_07920 [Oscillospiraceae bacterium]
MEAEERVIRELQELGKPFVVLLNSAQPQGCPGPVHGGGHRAAV